jgi:ATP-dependent exoDNAse (exonuclease V) alpha subunit
MTQQDIDQLYSRVDRKPKKGENHVWLFSKVVDAENYNTKKLNGLKTESRTYTIQITKSNDVDHNQEFEMVHYIMTRCPELKNWEITLKVGTPVFLSRNVDVSQGFYNGKKGVVIGFVGDDPQIQFRDEIIVVPRYQFVRNVKDGKKIQYVLSDVLIYHLISIFDSTVRVSYYPLKVCFAMTIHKSQSLTMDYAAIDFKDVFQSEMIYVALSRVRTLGGLILHNFDHTKIQFDETVIRFYESMEAL